MNKAKMTFRFDHDPQRHRGVERIKKETPNVIPLHSEEYRVLDEPIDPIPLSPAQTTSVDTSPQRKEMPLIDGQTLNQYTTDFGGWQSSFDSETNRVEMLIRDSGGTAIHRNRSIQPETGYMNLRTEQERGEGDRREPHQPMEPIQDHRWYVPEETPVYITKRPSSSWIKIVTSVAGAVITGVAFGFFVLSMFSSDSKGTQAGVKNNVPPGQAPAIAASTTPSADKTAAGSKTTPASSPTSAAVSSQTAAIATTSVNIPAKTYSFLQSGVFSSSQGADAAQADLKKKGFSAVSEPGDKYPVYVGMTLTRDEALGLSQQFQQKKVEVIVKNVELPAISKIKWNGKQADALPSYIAQGDKLLGLIAPLTAAQLSQAKPGTLDAATLQSIKTAHQAWTGMTTAANEGLADDAKAAVQKMNSSLNTAVVSLDEYKKNATPSYLWQAQSALMQYVIGQKELRKAVAAQ